MIDIDRRPASTPGKGEGPTRVVWACGEWDVDHRCGEAAIVIRFCMDGTDITRIKETTGKTCVFTEKNKGVRTP